MNTSKLTLIGLTGAKGAGKDTAAAHLVRAHDFIQIALADPIRYGLWAMFGIPDAYFTEHELKETPIDWLGVSPRYLMQTLGTEWGRNHVARDLWLRVASRRLERIVKNLHGKPVRIVVSDIRFDDEADWIRCNGGTVLHIRRPLVCPQNDAHLSEAGVTISNNDHIVLNTGTIYQLHAQLNAAMQSPEAGERIVSKDLIVRLREAAAQRVASTAMIGADDLIAAADALEIATAGMNAYCDELGSCRKAAGFGSANDPMAQEGFDAFGDPLCVAAFVESQFKRIVVERHSKDAGADSDVRVDQAPTVEDLVAELKALRDQEPVAWYCDTKDWGREYNGMPGMSNGAIGTPLYARPVPAEPSPESIACRSAEMDDWEEAAWRRPSPFASHMIEAGKPEEEGL